MVKRGPRTYTEGSITGSVRTALIQSLTRLFEAPVSDEAGTSWGASYKEQLQELDLKIARADRSRRALVRERTQTERTLSEVEGIMRSALGTSLQQLSQERDEVVVKLNEVDLTIAQLDRKRKLLRKERKKVEVWINYRE